MAEFRAALVCPSDFTQEAQELEDAHLRKRLRERAKFVQGWCEKVLAEVDSSRPLDDLRMELSSIAYPIAELMQYAGAVDNLRMTRSSVADHNNVIGVERVAGAAGAAARPPRSAKARKTSRR